MDAADMSAPAGDSAQEPPLKKIKVEYESEHEEPDNTVGNSEDPLVTATPVDDSNTNHDVHIKNDNSTLDHCAAPLAETHSHLPPSEDPTPPSVQLAVTAHVSDDTKDHHVGDEEDNEDLFGADGEDEKVNVGNESVVAPAAPETQNPDPQVPVTATTTPSSEIIPGEDSTTLVVEDTTTPVQTSATPEFSIPRKSAQTKTTAASTGSKQTYTPGTRYGLPAGVNVPVSIVKSKLLEAEMSTPGSKLMDVLKSLPVNLINDALTEYDDAVEIKGANSIRNHGAYLYGVVKRYVSVRERSLNGETVSGHNPMGDDGLTSAVQARLDQLVTSGFCTQQEMTDKVKSKIRMLSEKDAMCALDDLFSVERSQIRNFGSYLMGILNRYMRGEPSSKKSSSSSSMNQPGGGNHNHHHHSPPNRHRDHREPPHRSGPPHHNPSSLSLSSSYPPNSRNNHNSNMNQNRLDNRGSHYGDQQQGPPFRIDQHNNNNNNLQSFDGHRQQQQQGTHLVPSWQQNQPAQPNQFLNGPGNIPNAMGLGNMPNVMGPSSMNNNLNPSVSGVPPTNFNYPGQPQQIQQYPPQQHQLAPSTYMAQQPHHQQQQQSFGQPSSYSMPNTMQPQAVLPPNTTGMYQSQPNGMMLGQQQQSFSSSQQPSNMMNQSSSQFVPNHMSQAPGSIDILGLADKAASAIQALGANNKLVGQPAYLPSHQQMPPPQQSQGYHHHPQQQPQPPYNAGGGLNQSPPSNLMTQPPSRPGQPMFPQNQMYPPQPSHQPNYGGPNMMNQPPPSQLQQQQGSRGRSTASFHELPMSVQYALQV